MGKEPTGCSVGGGSCWPRLGLGRVSVIAIAVEVGQTGGMVSPKLRDVTFPEGDAAAAIAAAHRQLASFLRAHPTPQTRLTLVSDEDSEPAEVTVPAEVMRLVIEIFDTLARGDAVMVAPVHAELTTQQAAEMLNVSRPYLVKLLEDGEIPFRKVGTHRRVRLHDVLAYQQCEDEDAQRALVELTRHTEDLGLYGDV